MTKRFRIGIQIGVATVAAVGAFTVGVAAPDFYVLSLLVGLIAVVGTGIYFTTNHPEAEHDQ